MCSTRKCVHPQQFDCVIRVDTFKPNVFPIHISWTSSFTILGMSDGIFQFYSKKKLLFANTGEPDQTPSGFTQFVIVPHKGR